MTSMPCCWLVDLIAPHRVAAGAGSQRPAPCQPILLPHCLQRRISVPWVLPLLLFMLPGLVQAQYIFQTNNGTIQILGYNGPPGDVTIPSTITGLPVTSLVGAVGNRFTTLTGVTIPDSVTSIDSSAFSGCTNLRRVTMGSGVNSIVNDAFDGCTGLTNLEIGPNVTSIGQGAFDYCSSLGNLYIPDAVHSMGLEAFGFCTSLTNVTIGKGLTHIGGNAFLHCTNLASITIPSNIVSIDLGAFGDCTRLARVTIPDSVTTIDISAFLFCSSLQDVTLSSNVTAIGSYAFAACTSLAGISVDPHNPAFSSLGGVLFDKNQSSLIQCPGGRTGSYTVPNSVTSIGISAFRYCNGLTNITIPSSVTNITLNAFADCPNLTGVYFSGHPPSFDTQFGLFSNSGQVTVFYVFGTTGWGPTYSGRPTALWNPRPHGIGTGFGVGTNQFGFDIIWASGTVVVIEACTNLFNPIWIPLATNTLTDGSTVFFDPQWTNFPGRYYRIRAL